MYNRINQRVDIMMKNGLLEEAEKLYPHKKLNALHTVGYRELFEYFDENFTKELAAAQIKKHTLRFAKRQGTWFRKDKYVTCFDFQDDIQNIIQLLETKIKNLNN